MVGWRYIQTNINKNECINFRTPKFSHNQMRFNVYLHIIFSFHDDVDSKQKRMKR